MSSAGNGLGNRYSSSGYGGGASPSDTDVFMAIAAGGSANQRAAQTSNGPSAPVNPLVAARASGNTASNYASTTSDGLFPITEVDRTVSQSFDTSFGERRSKKTVLFVILAIVILAAIIVGAFYFLNQKQAADARANIAEATELIRETDSVIVPLDAALSATMGGGVVSSDLSTVMLQSSSTSTKLSSAETLLNDADRSRDLLSEKDIAGLDAAQASISARRSMLEIGRILLTANASVDEAANSLAMAYGSIADANAKVQSSLDQFSAYYETLAWGGDTSGYDLWACVQLDMDAATDVATARTWVDSARALCPTADFTVLDAYLAAQSTYLDLLVQIDTCLAGGDDAGANAITQQYNDAQWAAQTAYEQLPATAADLLSSAYGANAASQSAAYTSAREKCTAADDVLNTYLGITDPSKRLGLTGAVNQPVPAVTIADTSAPVDQAVEGEQVVEGVQEEVPLDEAA